MENGGTWNSPTGISPKNNLRAIGLTVRSSIDAPLTTNNGNDSVLTRSYIHENGFSSSKEKQRNGTQSRDVKLCQYEQNMPQALTKNFKTVSKGEGGRASSDTQKIEGPTLQDLPNDISKTLNSEHSEVSKVVPLKPQRSKKSLTKDTIVCVQSPNQSAWSIVGDAALIQSEGGSGEATRRVGDDNRLHSSTDRVSDNSAARKYHSGAGPSHHHQQEQQQQQQYFREFREAGNSMTSGEQQEDAQNNADLNAERLLSRFPTVPPRTLPLKKQWSRDRHSNTDCSHIHYRTNHDTTKRKQANVTDLYIKVSFFLSTSSHE
ncbi:uncharacterized protein LOC133482448 [Phyllopteryx taeniolatus]|uniref:uncharacterized protein LOC133482448 n=1 Tax=Phyllopteryx taeniolatus TaxID=161469 RepID=UPI002AD20061|nr:uncharacterized protein LOC133482448 [Phyllopteryx taeniolatus]